MFALGVGLRALDWPLLVLTEIYDWLVVSDEYRVPLFESWEMLKKIKTVGNE